MPEELTSLETSEFMREFVKAMAEIERYGRQKHGEKSTQARIESGNYERWERITSQANGEHAKEHWEAYLRGERHDHFGTLKHQLAAVAFNALMEFRLARLEDE